MRCSIAAFRLFFRSLQANDSASSSVLCKRMIRSGDGRKARESPIRLRMSRMAPRAAYTREGNSAWRTKSTSFFQFCKFIPGGVRRPRSHVIWPLFGPNHLLYRLERSAFWTTAKFISDLKFVSVIIKADASTRGLSASAHLSLVD
jgi:hypothetical protein